MNKKKIAEHLDSESRRVEILVRTIRSDYQYSYDLFDEYGNLILSAHNPISESLINHLITNKIDRLYYDPSAAGSASIDNVAGLNTKKSIISEELRKETVDHTRDLMEYIREIYSHSLGEGISKSRIDSSRLMVYKLLDDVERNSDGIFEPFAKLREMDDYTYHHSANVSILIAIFAARLDLSEDIRLSMGLGGLLHDLGKSSISKEIINKARLSDEDFDLIKEHPHVGYKLVENNSYMQDLEKRMVLLHHERADGEGYPYGFDLEHYQDQVQREVRLFSLCNEYILMVLKRPGEKALTSRLALRKMLNMLYAPYKNKYYFLAKDFRDFIKALGFIVNKGEYFLGRGDLVRLNTGEIGIIEEMNKLFPLNPKIRILKNSKLETLKRPINIDMLKDYQNYIANVYDRSSAPSGKE